MADPMTRAEFDARWAESKYALRRAPDDEDYRVYCSAARHFDDDEAFHRAAKMLRCLSVGADGRLAVVDARSH